MTTSPFHGIPIAFLRGAAVFGFVLNLAPGAQASMRWVTLEAIHQLENPSNSERPGPCGELGPYQFRRETWQKYSRAPFSHALDRRAADQVAARHYEWIKGELTRIGVEPSTYNIALVWNGGMKAVTGSHAPSAALDYARRAANLAESFQSTELVDVR